MKWSTKRTRVIIKTMTPTPLLMEAATLERALREAFPRVAFAMAYGSGVFAQKNHDASTSLLDLVFAVDDPAAWHAANLERNASHYSLLRLLGAQGLADFQVQDDEGERESVLGVAE